MTAPHRARLLRGCVLAGLLAALPPGAATAQGAPPARAPASPTPPRGEPPKADPAFEAARSAFEALPEAERRAVQEALVWTGGFTSVVTGGFGRRTFDALVARQRAAGGASSGVLGGVLGERERAALLAEGRRAREAAGFALRIDAATGVALGVPTKLLPREQTLPQGTRWQSADGRVTLETRAFAPGETDLQATFDRVSAATPERKVTYKLKRPDFVVVTGETPGGRFYIRYAETPAGVRGFTLGYDKALAAEIDRVVIAVANSFEPRPTEPLPTEPRPTKPVPTESRPTKPPPTPRVAGIPAASGAPAMAASAPPPEPRPGRMATALVVAPGRLVTALGPLAACATPRVAGAAARVVAADAPTGLVLLDGAGTEAASLSSGPAPERGTSLVVVAMEAAGAVVVPAETGAAERVVAPLQPGAAGAPILDRAGRLVGLVASYPTTPTRVAGIVPPTALPVVEGRAVMAFLASHGIAGSAAAPGGPLSTGEIAARVAPALRTVTCD